MSLPSRGAWIEIKSPLPPASSSPSLPSRGAWIEIAILGDMRHIGLSLPSRGAWLEIRAGRSVGCEVIVAHRGGSDD